MEGQLLRGTKHGVYPRCPPTYNIASNKWVFKTKVNVDFQMCKTRFVVNVFHQNPGIDYAKAFSLVVKASTIKIVLNIAVSKNWVVTQLDINKVFLNGNLQ